MRNTVADGEPEFLTHSKPRSKNMKIASLQHASACIRQA